MKNKELKRRIIDISYRHKLSHLGSCLTAVDIISDIYDAMNSDDLFILSSGHAGLALYVVLEKRLGINAEMLLEKHGIHPGRDVANHIFCSTGSLGHGIGIAVGAALANNKRSVWCLISDGEYAEGSVHEALNFLKNNPKFNIPISIYVNDNGYSAYKETHIDYKQNVTICRTKSDQFPFLKGLDAHYYVMNEEDYNFAMEVLV